MSYSDLNEKDRLLRVLARGAADRPPVICPGGMMTMACREVMLRHGCRWPEAHRDPQTMARLSLAMHDEAGLENTGAPFCMTVETEAWGGEIEDGDLVTPPSVLRYPLSRVADWRKLRDLDPALDGRLPAIVESTRILSAARPDVPVIANLVGPLSLATSLLDASHLYRTLRTEAGEVHQMLDFLCRSAIAFGRALVRAGACAVAVSDPSATGEILGPRLFREFALPYLSRISGAMRSAGTPVIVHICGDLGPVLRVLPELDADALSIDAMVPIEQAAAAVPGRVLMGNVSTVLLEQGPPAKVREATSRAIGSGIGILAPACGVSARTPVEHLRAMTSTVSERQ